MIDVQGFRDLSTRLEPLRRMLGDLTTVADMTTTVLQSMQEASVETKQLREEAASLRKNVNELVTYHDEAIREHETKLAGLRAAIDQAEYDHAQRMEKMAQQQADADRALQVTQEALETLRAYIREI